MHSGWCSESKQVFVFAFFLWARVACHRRHGTCPPFRFTRNGYIPAKNFLPKVSVGVSLPAFLLPSCSQDVHWTIRSSSWQWAWPMWVSPFARLAQANVRRDGGSPGGATRALILYVSHHEPKRYSDLPSQQQASFKTLSKRTTYIVIGCLTNRQSNGRLRTDCRLSKNRLGPRVRVPTEWDSFSHSTPAIVSAPSWPGKASYLKQTSYILCLLVR
jgi:hypothetical protein